MPKGPVRRAQLIAPFGVGAMLVMRDGMSLVTAGLDHWYQRESGDDANVDPREYVVEEWRLARELGVDEFRLPPDYRRPRRFQQIGPNAGLTVPFHRFPQWHFCPFCHLLVERPLTERGRAKCPECSSKGKNWYLRQVPLVAVCQHGHLQDFPWRAWAHESLETTCTKPLRLIATGGATLAAQQVRCDCGKGRPLGGATGRDLRVGRGEDSPVIPCGGYRPWLGKDAAEPCDQALRGSLRSASNVYFAQVRSSIYLPRGTMSVPPELVDLLGAVHIRSFIEILGGSVTVEKLRKQFKPQLASYTDQQIQTALQIRQGTTQDHTDEPMVGDDWQTAFRRAEYAALQRDRNEDVLKIQPGHLAPTSALSQYVDQVMLVDKLRETRVLIGFTRVYPETDRPVGELKAMLWRKQPDDETWLPAYVVHGEGIFLRLNEARLHRWGQIPAVQQRVKLLADNYELARQTRKLRERAITPRFVLIHTLAHLLMNRLTFECGYSSASLRERLFVSDNAQAPMAGLMIYTAAGDSEGTMGGLVRMGKPEHFEPVLYRALEEATWCSADPVCMELGEKGQGPDSCNLAACHGCALVPETACEEFNYFLDRGLVVGSLSDPSLGFFTFESPSFLEPDA